MKKTKIFILISILGILGVYAVTRQPLIKKAVSVEPTDSLPAFRDGDLIFQVNTGGQGLAIQLATHSRYTHVGILFKEGNEWMVYEAVEPVRVVSLKGFAAAGDDGTYAVRRLAKGDSLLTSKTLGQMKAYLKKQVGKHYDIHFGWSDDRLYCSELVWKCYNQAGISIGPLKKLKEFDLTDPIVKTIMAERYGKNIPYEEKVVSPGDIFDNADLVDVL